MDESCLVRLLEIKLDRKTIPTNRKTDDGDCNCNYDDGTTTIQWEQKKKRGKTDDLCGDISRDNIIDRTALDILEKLPKTFEIWRVKETLQMKLCPTGVVLLQELQRYNELVERIRKTLKLLRKVCESVCVCSAE